MRLAHRLMVSATAILTNALAACQTPAPATTTIATSAQRGSAPILQSVTMRTNVPVGNSSVMSVDDR